MLQKFIFIVIFVDSVTYSETAKRSFDIELQRPIFNNVTSPMKNCGGNFRKLATSQYAYDLWVEFDRQLTNNAEIQIFIQVKALKSPKGVTFLNLKLKVCDALNSVKSVPLLVYFWKEFKRTTNVPTKCPIKGNIRYNITNFIVTNEIFPTYTPILDFNYTANLYENDKLFLNYLVQGSIIPRKN